MFKDWDCDEPFGSVICRYSRGDIVFEHRRVLKFNRLTQEREWLCIVQRSLHLPLEVRGKDLAEVIDKTIRGCGEYLDILLLEVLEAETTMRWLDKVNEKDECLSCIGLWLYERDNVFRFRSLDEDTFFYQNDNTNGDMVWTCQSTVNLSREMIVTDKDFEGGKYKMLCKIKALSSANGREISRLAQNLHVLRKMKKKIT